MTVATSHAIRPTRRGLGLTFVVVLGFVLAHMHGARSLGAIVFPGVVALVAGFVSVRAIDAPRVTRTLPPVGQRGESGTVQLHIDTDATMAVVRDRLPLGLDGDSTVEAVLGDEPITYDVQYTSRGEHPVGPVRITVQDVLGLAKREFRTTGTDALTVYPRLTSLTPSGRNRLLAVVGRGRAPERTEFDHLREYTQGDSLRDIHWKASAKRDDLVVTEYVASDVAERVVIHAEAETGHADEDPSPADAMAEATASLVVALLDAGVPVTVRTPTGSVAADAGERRSLLAHLARTTAGTVGAGPEAAVHVRASTDSVRVRLGDAEMTFADLRDGAVDGRTDGIQTAAGVETPTDSPRGVTR